MMGELLHRGSNTLLSPAVADILSRPARLWARWETRLVALTVTVICIFEVTGTFDVGSQLTGLPLYILTLAGTTLLAIIVAARHRRFLAAPVIGYGFMVLATAISYERSQLSPSVTAAGVTEAMKNFLFVLALGVLAARVVPWRALALGLTVGTGLIGYLSGLNEFLLGRNASFLGYDTVTTYEGVGFEAGRHAGPMPDPNFWGRELVAVIPFSIALVREAWLIRREHPRRAALQAIVGLWGIGGQLIAVYLTGSRGTYLSLAAGAAVILLAAGVRFRMLALGGLIAGPLALAVPGVASRLFSFDFNQSGLNQSAAVDASVMERLATQRVALAMARDNLISGVGPDGYFTAFGQYGAVTRQALARVVAPHNLYLGTTAELGLLGLGAWLVTIGTALFLAAQATRRRTAPQRPYAAAVLAGIVAWSIASVFLHASHIRIILALAVLAAAVDIHTRRYHVSTVAPLARPVWLPHWSRREMLPVVSAATVGALLLGGAGLTLGRSYEATAAGRLVPVGSDTYLLDLRTRSAVVTTFAVLHELQEENRVDVQGDPASGLMSLTTTGGTAAQARHAAEEAISSGSAYSHRATMDQLYRPAWSAVQIRPVHSTMQALAGALLGSAIGVGAILAYRRRRDLSGR